MKQTIIYFSIFIVLSTSIKAQRETNIALTNMDIEIKKRKRSEINTKNIENIYLFDSFKEGKILFTESNTERSIKMNYNLFNQQIEVIEKTDTFNLTTGNDKLIKANSLTFKNISYLKNKKIINSFAVTLIDDHISLFKVNYKFFIEPQKETSYGSATPGKYIDKYYYILSYKNTNGQVFKNKKEFISFFKGSEHTVKASLKKHKFNFKKEEKLIELVKHINNTIATN